MAQNRNKLQEKRKQVDSTQLQLQNLLYEEEYLKKEILKCTQIRSEDDDIDLISIEEFYENAPESISKPVSFFFVYEPEFSLITNSSFSSF